jgi:cytochrome c biogenesis factor
VSLAVFINPLVTWLWVGGFLLLLGTLVSMWPGPRPAVRTAAVAVPRGSVGVTP